MATRPPEYKSSDSYSYLKEAGRCIEAALDFSKMPEGQDYWADVISRLKAHSLAIYNNKPVVLPGKVVSPAANVASALNGPTHVLHQGSPCCRFTTERPQDWPQGHQWVHLKDWKAANCDGCIVTASELVEKEAQEEAALAAKKKTA